MSINAADPLTPLGHDEDEKFKSQHIEDEKSVDYADAARAEDFQHSVSFKRSLVIHRVVGLVLLGAEGYKLT
jgi:hypothetical protein